MISAREYYNQIVRPTVDEFFGNNKDLRLAMLACTVTLHLLDYIGQNGAENAKQGDKKVNGLKKAAQDQFAFKVVEGFALASKHCNVASLPGFDSGQHMVAYPAVCGVARCGGSFLGDTVGGVTVRGGTDRHVNLMGALTETQRYFESEFPELVQ